MWRRGAAQHIMGTMKVLLLHPALPANRRHKRILPLGLLYLAAYLRESREDVRVEILDAHILDLDLEQAVARVLEAAPDLLGIGYWTVQAPFAFALSERVKAARPETVVVHGGVHPSSCPEEAAARADYVVLSEGERTLVALVDALRSGSDPAALPGVARLEDGALRRSPPGGFIGNLDELPLPAWDLVPIERYDTPLHVVGGRRLPIIASRGCPYNCAFCVSPLLWQREVRWRSGANVAREMAEAGARYGIDQFHFWDDNLLLNRKIVEEICGAILERGLAVRWVALTRADHLVQHADLLPLLRRAGCIGIEIGIESANPEALQYYEKDQSLATIERALRLQRQAGMTPLYTLMAFSPGETLSAYYFQTRFINRVLGNGRGHRLFVGQFATAYPGTRFFEEVGEQGMVLARSWDDYHHHNIKFLPTSLLEDVPELTVRRLGWQDLFVLLLESYLWRYDAYPCGFDRRRLLAERRALRRLVPLIDGRRSLREIAERLHEAAAWPRDEAYRFTAFTLMIMAQAGLVRSAGPPSGEPVRPRRVRFNRWYANLVYDLLGALGGRRGGSA
jgi:radical SAM superfamily enzyme YgiQ (UPF0313 family)